MKHNFLIISDDKIVIDQKISKILSDIPFKEREIVKYDMSDTLISSMIEELDTYNFLSFCKVVICYNCAFLEGEVNKEIKYLKKYLLNPSDNYLIMVATKISEKKEIKEMLSKDIEIIDSGISSEVLVKKNLESYTMDNRTVKFFVDYCLGNNEKILNELEKIKTYKMDDIDKNITVQDIEKIAIREYDENIFDLVNAIAKRDKNKMFDIYLRIVRNEKDIVNVVASVSSQLRMLYSVKILYSYKLSVNEMASIINVKPRAISIALENCDNFSCQRLLFLLNELADIDYKSKSGIASGDVLFETFLMSV